MVLGIVGITDRRDVLIVDQAVAVEVYVTDVSQRSPVGRIGIVGTIGKLLVGIEKPSLTSPKRCPIENPVWFIQG